MIDERTSYLRLPLPHPANLLSQDVGRIREALQDIDAGMSLHSARINETHVLLAAEQRKLRLRQFHHFDF